MNFIAHNGYYCCFFCFLRGIHQHGKRQYQFESSTELRTAQTFARDSHTAATLKTNEKGHLGMCIFSDLLDVQLPYSIIIDYAHATLLRHAKAIFSEIYRRLSPSVRIDVDHALKSQAFPHFFHRRMKPLKDLSFIKATELRNILFYGFLPIVHQLLPINLVCHLALFICGMRLLHGRPIFADRTSDIADILLKKYCEDFPKFYTGLENLVLHLHLHYKIQYKHFGAFAYLGSFGQENMMGYMGSNFTGTRYHGDLIAQNYTMDIILHCSHRQSDLSNKKIDGPYDPIHKFDFKSNDIFLQLHQDQCNCSSINSCLTAFRRCKIRQHVYHSISYNRRQTSVSFLVRYCDLNDPTKYLFGQISLFVRANTTTYAVIRQYQSLCLFSDLCRSSSYYRILRESIDQLFYVVTTDLSPNYELVLESRIIDHCIFVKCSDYYIVTSISSYDEHD